MLSAGKQTGPCAGGQPGAPETGSGRIPLWTTGSMQGWSTGQAMALQADTTSLGAGNPLGEMLGACRTGFATAVVFSFFVNLLVLVIPIYTFSLFDRVLGGGGNVFTLAFLAGTATAALLVQALIEVARTFLFVRISAFIDSAVSEKLLAVSLRLACARGVPRDTELLARMNSLRHFLAGHQIFLLLDLPWVPLFLAFLFYLNMWIGLVSSVVAVLLFLLALANRWLTSPLSDRARSAVADSMRKTDITLRNADIIDAMGMAQDLGRRWSADNDAALDHYSTYARRSGVMNAIGRTMQLSSIIAIMTVSVVLVLDPTSGLSQGAMMASVILVGRIMMPVQSLVTSWTATHSALEDYRRVAAALRTGLMFPDLPEPPADTARSAVDAPAASLAEAGGETPEPDEVPGATGTAAGPAQTADTGQGEAAQAATGTGESTAAGAATPPDVATPSEPADATTGVTAPAAGDGASTAVTTTGAGRAVTATAARVEPTVSVNGLHFHPPTAERPILSDITFILKAGSSLGILGRTGSGKSSLARLLVGIDRPTSGTVRLGGRSLTDGRDLHSWPGHDLGQHIGYLPQDVSLFSGTIRDNITRFADDWTRDSVLDAARLANVDAMIKFMPRGYQTQVGPGGALLSGGQVQRVALARALYGPVRLVVLDEPNANLDVQGERALAATILELKRRGVTVVVILHRENILRALDNLLVLVDGRVGAAGPRDKVLAQFRPPQPPVPPDAGAGESPGLSANA